MDSDDDRDEYVSSWRGVPGTIILLNMFDPGDKNTATVSHVATCRMVKQYLRNSNSHLIGVCLYGTEDSAKTIFGTKGVVDILPLSAPTLEDYKKLRSVDLQKYEQVKDLELSEALGHASKLFANCKKQLLSRTIIMLTRLDAPPVQSDQRPTFIKVTDVVDSNIDIKIVNVAESDYQVHPFYEDFLKNINKGGDYVVPKPIWDPTDIENVMHQQSHRHLAVARLDFQIGEGFSIGVGVYNLISKAGNSFKKVNLDRETNATLTSTIKTVKVATEAFRQDVSPMDVDDAQPKETPLLKSEIVHYQFLGGERIEFTDKEKNDFKNPFGPPMIKLLGFKPANLMCKEKWFLKTGAFLYPHEQNIEGSTQVFKALHKACIESEVVAICVLCTRVNAKPNIVALSPSKFPPGSDMDCGFDVIHMPFIEHVRNLSDPEDDNDITVTEEKKKLMKKILEGIKFEYKPKMFQNPKLVSEFRAIESIALDDEDVEPFIDTTKPDSKQFEVIPADLFEELFGPFGAVATKRVASREPSSSKRAKTDEDFDESDVLDRVKHQTVKRYTVAQLKDILKRKGDSTMPALTGLKKDELVNLVYQYYS